MISNETLKQAMALDLGIDLSNRDALASEVLKYQDIHLLPHSSTDTMLGEIFENNGSTGHTKNQNLIGYLFTGHQLQDMVKKLKEITKADAQIPTFVFSKDHIASLGFKIPALFNIGFHGNMNSAKDFSVKVSGVTKQRIDNYQSPGTEIYAAFSSFTLNKTKTYRQKIRFNYISVALFYAEKVEISLDKGSAAAVDFDFDAEAAKVEVIADSDSKKSVPTDLFRKPVPFCCKFSKRTAIWYLNARINDCCSALILCL